MYLNEFQMTLQTKVQTYQWIYIEHFQIDMYCRKIPRPISPYYLTCCTILWGHDVLRLRRCYVNGQRINLCACGENNLPFYHIHSEELDNFSCVVYRCVLVRAEGSRETSYISQIYGMTVGQNQCSVILWSVLWSKTKLKLNGTKYTLIYTQRLWKTHGFWKVVHVYLRPLPVEQQICIPKNYKVFLFEIRCPGGGK